MQIESTRSEKSNHTPATNVKSQIKLKHPTSLWKYLRLNDDHKNWSFKLSFRSQTTPKPTDTLRPAALPPQYISCV